MKIFLALLCAFLSFAPAAGQLPTDTVRVYFAFDSAALTPEARASLERFVATYTSAPGATGITIRGHCDSLGSDAYNEALASRRTSAVQDYLLSKGLPVAVVLRAEGFGEREPVVSNHTPAGRQQNRRVEILWSREAARAPQPPVTPPDTIGEFSREAIDSVKEGTTLRLRNINFYGGRHTFLPQSRPALEELLQTMQRYPSLEIEIQGHICCLFGSRQDGADYDAGDMRLSHNRARAVYNYLVEGGIDKKRMTYRGFAAASPLDYPEYTEADRTANRRVEIKVVKK